MYKIGQRFWPAGQTVQAAVRYWLVGMREPESGKTDVGKCSIDDQLGGGMAERADGNTVEPIHEAIMEGKKNLPQTS